MQETVKNLANILGKASLITTPVATAPTMLSAGEQNLLYLLSKEYYTGEGVIFDGGCCLGGCAQSFARGLAGRTDIHAGEHIYVYERGLCDGAYLQDFIEKKCHEKIQIGQNFLHITENNLQACIGNEHLKLLFGDILEQDYPEKIEIFFLDVCKNIQINHAMQLLLDRGIPGKTVVVHQDYVHSYLPWIHVSMGFLHEYFEPIGSVSGSFLWLLRKKITVGLLVTNVWETLGLAEKLDCFTRYYGYLKPNQRTYTDLAKARLLAFHGMLDDALKQINFVCQQISALPDSVFKASLQDCVDIKGSCTSDYNHPMRLESLITFTLDELCRIRHESANMGQGSQTTAKYQDDIAYAIANNTCYGDAFLEVGCFKGGLTVQLAYMAHALNKHLYVIDISKENLEAAQNLVNHFGYGSSVSFFCMTFEQFESQNLHNNYYVLAVIDGSHYYPHVVADCKVLQKIHHRVRVCIFHDFTLNGYEGERRVNDAIFDVFCHDVRCFPVGSNVHFESLTAWKEPCVRKFPIFFAGTEGVMIYGEDMKDRIENVSGATGVLKSANRISTHDHENFSIQNDITRDINELNEKIQRLEREVFSLYNSRSWKITTPLRYLYERFCK